MNKIMTLYLEFNGVIYEVDPSCCSLDFTLSQYKDNKTKACLEISEGGKAVILDLKQGD